MKKTKIPYFVQIGFVFLLIFSGCSSNSKKGSENSQIEVMEEGKDTASNKMLGEESAEDISFEFEDEDKNSLDEKHSASMPTNEQSGLSANEEERTDYSAASFDSDVKEEAAPVVAAVGVSESNNLLAGSQQVYEVQAGDTLMLVAFKIYGDYGRWKEIFNLNSSALGSSHHLKKGMKLSYVEPTHKFEWNPDGNPYLIKGGDTLGSISSDVYGTKMKWRKLWDNNKPMIKNPNLIFAGFTLYWIK